MMLNLKHLKESDLAPYRQLMKTEGAAAALTQLHHDLAQWELEAFEGEKGYQPDLWRELHEVRALSRELWELDLHKPCPK
jgi:hypothetical protein